MKNVFLKPRFFIVSGLVVLMFVASYVVNALYVFACVLAIGLVVLAIAEWVFFGIQKKNISCHRTHSSRISLGDIQKVDYHVKNSTNYDLKVEVLDELPAQLQNRKSTKKLTLSKHSESEFSTSIRPTERGLYKFGHTHLMLSLGFPSLLEFRDSINNSSEVKVIPSILQMRKFQLQVFSKTATMSGIRRIRALGENDEFEHIRNYQQGDNIKAINWKASSRNRELMVNRFQNTKSQNVYCIIDKGRAMKMPFDDLSLMDYAINSSLVLSNIILRNYDKTGLITFSNKLGALVKAESKLNQLENVIDKLYHQKTDFLEPSFELLNSIIRSKIRRRSILILFTNFENLQDFERNAKYLKAINQRHLLVVVFFRNSEIISLSKRKTTNRDEIYLKTFAQRNILEKETIVNSLKQMGVQSILTNPQDLSVNVINKYLEIKAKRMS